VRSPGSYQDQISLITYDGDWNTGNNWENLDQGYPIRGYVYWSLTET